MDPSRSGSTPLKDAQRRYVGTKKHRFQLYPVWYPIITLNHAACWAMHHAGNDWHWYNVLLRSTNITSDSVSASEGTVCMYNGKYSPYLRASSRTGEAPGMDGGLLEDML